MNKIFAENIEKLGFASTEVFVKKMLIKYLEEKLVEYKKEIDMYEKKYKMDYYTFEKKYMSPDQPEDFEKWDDYIVWEAENHGMNIIQQKLNEIKPVTVELEDEDSEYVKKWKAEIKSYRKNIKKQIVMEETIQMFSHIINTDFHTLITP